MLKVFLAEDEIVMREGIKNNIDWQGEGFEFVGDAGDGELAYPIIQKTRPDILITDIKMPFMDGLELSRLVKHELPETKIILLSGYDEFQMCIRDRNETMKKTMKINGMMCGHCEARVKKALEAVEGVQEAVVSHEAGNAVVTLSSDVADEVLKKAVEDQDYEVVSVES